VKHTRRSNDTDGIVALFEPQSIAVVGSMREGRFGGYLTVKHLLDFGFRGKIYPVNPNYDTVLGMKVYPTLKDIAGGIDLAVMMTAAPAVPEIIEDCAAKNVKAAIIVSDGFTERDEEGARLQREVDTIARRAGLRLLGPNTIGVVNSANGLITTPYRVPYEEVFSGGIAICSQTGLLGPQTLPLHDMRYGLSKICDFGNKCDIDELDLLEYLGSDPQTRVIAMHLEEVRDGRSFLRKLKEVVRAKPVLILKPGRTRESRKAVTSHTGSLAGEDHVYDGAFRQAGAIRVDSFKELVDIPKIFAWQPLPPGNRLAIITISGGAGVLGIDTAVQQGLALARLSPSTLDKLGSISPVLTSNPIDLGPGLPAFMKKGDMASHLHGIIETLVDDENVDCISVACPWMLRGALAEVFGPLRDRSAKPIAFWVPSPSLTRAQDIVIDLETLGFPAYPDCDSSVRALAIAYKYSVARSRARQLEEEAR
jgi:acyl-CoA synthetase (NDP forming)